ncbi:MAG: DNA gyrase/topoisomerase IV subunit A [Bacteroidales bacterium]|nr:DNA gyrase/topoisomerase IV subunit A [Bacteroidales bacterium]
MSEEIEEIEEIEGSEDNAAQEEESVNEEPAKEFKDNSKGSKFSRVINAGENKYKLPGMYRDWFLDYASYVMLDRAVPYIEDGLKPVQRRILHALKLNEDGRYHKVAGIVGDTMKFHPHGDASIYDALVGMQQKELLIEGQGNWGNILTGDSAAAMRYIEAKLSKFALDVVYNPKITEWVPTYDRASVEPVTLPVKFPLLLAQGSKGIGVGLKILILPHNFNELLDASIAVFKGEEFTLYPDFPTGGIADCSKYNGGLRGGRVRIRATITKRDKRTLVIEDLPFGETTGSVIASIISANDSGKIKIKKIDDYSSDKVEIVLQLANDISPDKTIDALYAFTKCSVVLSPNTVVIKDGKPEFMTVEDVVRYGAWHTRELFEKELQITLSELEDDWHRMSLERIFFEEKVYRVLENDARSWEEQIQDVTDKMLEYQHLVRKPITNDDILKLVEKPVRKISKFDIKAANERIKATEDQIAKVKYNLEHLTQYTIAHFRNIKKKYGDAHPRLTRIEEFENINVQKVAVANAKLYADMEGGFIGIDEKKIDNAAFVCECSDIDDIIAFMKNGDYIITPVKDKAFIGKNLIHVGVFKKGDERTIYNAVYRDGKNGIYFAKRFAVTGVTKNKTYNLTQGKPDSSVIYFSANPNGEAEVVRVLLRNRPKLKKTSDTFDFAKLAVKGRGSRGNILSRNPILRIQLKSKGVSTIGGKEIWFDSDISRLNDAGRGLYLGEFLPDEHILVILKNGRYYTSSFDLSNRYQGSIEKICKLDPDLTYSVVYYDKQAGFYYIKRFSFEVSDNNEQCFISEGSGSRMVAISEDVYPRLQITFKGKNASRGVEIIDVAGFIGKKGFKAKGKRLSQFDVDTVEFIEPIPVPELEVDEESEDRNADVIEIYDGENGPAAPAFPEPAQSKDSPEAGTPEGSSFDDDDPIELSLF